MKSMELTSSGGRVYSQQFSDPQSQHKIHENYCYFDENLNM